MMTRSHRQQQWHLRNLLLVSFLALLSLIARQSDALYFYMEGGEEKCFIEELPVDTVVVGHYMAESWDPEKNTYIIDENMGVKVTVIEKDNEHILVDTTAPSEGKFAFTSHIAGNHDICLSAQPHHTHPYHITGQHPEIRLHLDVIIGESKPDNSEVDRSHITDLAGRVKNLNDKLKDIRKEQQYQREREALFRNESEKTNARAVVYSAIQGVVLVAACVWQLRTLRGFFSEKKFS